jgi:hypothetical protein
VYGILVLLFEDLCAKGLDLVSSRVRAPAIDVQNGVFGEEGGPTLECLFVDVAGVPVT